MNGADDAVVPGKSHRIPNPVWRGPRFQNPWDGFRIPGFRELWKVLFDPGDNPPPHGRTTASANRMFSDTAGGWLLDNPGATPADIRERFAAREVDGSAIASPPAEGVRCMWVGHSTLLVQMDGVTFLTDPIFSDRASPLQVPRAICITATLHLVPPSACRFCSPPLPPAV